MQKKTKQKLKGDNLEIMSYRKCLIKRTKQPVISIQSFIWKMEVIIGLSK